ncbi:MAG: FG-GAP-like repeat-containing protein [Maribacter sp.]|uniref:VCBS repeat-containing protein n=1 Tax=Maribacter sp. TaxID=1897614 RepID=UPI003299008F
MKPNFLHIHSSKTYRSVLILLVLIVLNFSCNPQEKTKNTKAVIVSTEQQSKALFELVSSDSSNLKFNNAIKENVATLDNLFNFDYFYNGAGVGVEDFNNDGLLDIFFCGNQVPNKLFLNKGNLVFEDISETAKINQGKKWSNGVTFLDINNDGFKDIYVSQGGPNNRNNRDNLLYINNTDLTFTEMAQTYGIADKGISTQSAFFDFDKDGDLDCIVMNENELYGVDPINLKKMVGKDDQTAYFNSSHLYRNDNGKFKDITKDAGLLRPIFGLGLSVSDINNDSWLDVYIASDYYLPDALFINNKNGTFTDQIKTNISQISFYGMGVDIADINNDKLQDIFTLDMASTDHFRAKTLMASMSTDRFSYLVDKENFQHQYMFNSLQLNMGNTNFNNIAQLTKTANTDWSWSVLLSDFDNDEDKDIFITNGYRRYALDNDLQLKVFEARRKFGNKVPLKIKQQLYDQMPSEKLPNILYQNKSDLNFESYAQEWGLATPSFSNGAATGDLDNDGDLDLVINNIDENAFLYKNNAIEHKLGNFLKVKTIGKSSETFAKVKISYKGKSQFIETKRVRGYMSAQDNTAHFGLGKETTIDTVHVEWPNGKIEERFVVNANTTLEFHEEDAQLGKISKKPSNSVFKTISPVALGLDFRHKENLYDDFEREILLPYKQSNFGPFIAKGDIDGDGKEDMFIGGASGQSGQLYLQRNNGFKPIKSEALNTDSGYEDMEAVFFDFDNDNDLDLYVVSGGNAFDTGSSYYTDRLYINDGKAKFSKWENTVLGKNAASGKTVTAIDFDKDGDNDLLVGNRIIPKNYPRHSSSILYENIGNELINVSDKIAPVLKEFGIVNSVIATDFNSDGWEDLIVVGEWTSIGFLENNKGKFVKKENVVKTAKSKGWWFSIKETDINNDGAPDYIVGNAGLNLKYQASPNKPFKIYADDFDGNGTHDIVLSKKYQGEYVPVRGRECSSQQMPFIKSKFPNYTSFASATLADIYGEKLKASYTKEVNTFESVMLVNNGDGSFVQKSLPIEAQLFPILDISISDFNKDGFEDCIVGGNIYETEVETPRLDAISGLILLSNGSDAYIPLKNSKSGLYPKGNVKSFEILTTSEQQILVVGKNDDNVETYILTEN